MTSAGANGLTLLNPDSGTKTPFLSQLRFANFAHACSDGHIIFSAEPEGKIQNDVWVADADGANSRKLTSGKFDYLPICTPDAKTVIYEDADGKLDKLPLQGGASQKMSELAVFSRFTASPDGKLVAFVTFRLGDPKKSWLCCRSIPVGRPVSRNSNGLGWSPSVAFGDGPVSFTRDGKRCLSRARRRCR